MIRILHLSDPHFGAASTAAAAAFAGGMESAAPDLTVLSGDLTMRARRAELRDARRFVDALPRPLLLIPGNHDIPAFNQPFQRFFAPFRRYRTMISNDLEPELRLPGIHAVGVNSSIAFGHRLDWSTGHLTRTDLRRIDTRFADSPPESLRILVLHHPLLAPPGHLRAVVQPLDSLLELAARHRIDLIASGHFHISHTATIGRGWSSAVSQAPTVCSTRLQGEPPGFHVISVAGDAMSIELRQFDGQRFTTTRTRSFRREGTGWLAANDCHET